MPSGWLGRSRPRRSMSRRYAGDPRGCGGVPGGAPVCFRAEAALAEAELSRVEGRSAPDLWARAAELREPLGMPYELAYIRLRQAEAMLKSGGSRVGGRRLTSARPMASPASSARSRCGRRSRRWPGGPASTWRRHRRRRPSRYPARPTPPASAPASARYSPSSSMAAPTARSERPSSSARRRPRSTSLTSSTSSGSRAAGAAAAAAVRDGLVPASGRS